MFFCDKKGPGWNDGARVEVTGIYRATPLRVNPRMRTLKAVYKIHIDVVHFRKTEKRDANDAGAA